MLDSLFHSACLSIFSQEDVLAGTRHVWPRWYLPWRPDDGKKNDFQMEVVKLQLGEIVLKSLRV